MRGLEEIVEVNRAPLDQRLRDAHATKGGLVLSSDEVARVVALLDAAAAIGATAEVTASDVRRVRRKR